MPSAIKRGALQKKKISRWVGWLFEKKRHFIYKKLSLASACISDLLFLTIWCWSLWSSLSSGGV